MTEPVDPPRRRRDLADVKIWVFLTVPTILTGVGVGTFGFLFGWGWQNDEPEVWVAAMSGAASLLGSFWIGMYRRSQRLWGP